MYVKRFWKRFVFHFVRVLLAAVLLYWDQRIFLFYAFTLLLAGLESFDRLRAIVRVFQSQNTVKLAVMLEKMQIPLEALEGMAEQARTEMSAEEWKSFEDDVVLATRQ